MVFFPSIYYSASSSEFYAFSLQHRRPIRTKKKIKLPLIVNGRLYSMSFSFDRFFFCCCCFQASIVSLFVLDIVINIKKKCLILSVKFVQRACCAKQARHHFFMVWQFDDAPWWRIEVISISTISMWPSVVAFRTNCQMKSRILLNCLNKTQLLL